MLFRRITLKIDTVKGKKICNLGKILNSFELFSVQK